MIAVVKSGKLPPTNIKNADLFSYNQFVIPPMGDRFHKVLVLCVALTY